MHFNDKLAIVVTSNKPYSVSDGSNPFFDGRAFPKFNLRKSGVHSGHVQKGLLDPFYFVPNGKGKCQDGYTMEVTGAEGVRVLVASKAKPNRSILRQEFPHCKEVIYKPDFGRKKLLKPVVFDMDMSSGDILVLIYLLKVPVEVIDLKLRYTAENSVKYGAPRDTDHPELRQPLAFEVWQSISKLMKPGSKITMLTSGPLSNLARIILKDKNASSLIEVFYFHNFLLCPISSSLLSSLASIDWKSFSLNVKSSAIDEDGDAVLEWENLPPLVHISHCKAAPDLIYGCVPPLLLSLLS
ncbi:hypothetical protein Scep_009742 [Stephania cephalantha]|uniref:Uncharacterized protein n=1 Tax=Stephania cephalantha TaxID=152367 RepID=A0AAP0JTP8_9MAGN